MLHVATFLLFFFAVHAAADAVEMLNEHIVFIQ